MDEFFDRQGTLVSKLLADYRKDIPPIYSRARDDPSLSRPLFVNMSLIYLKLLSINEPEQTITLIFEYYLTWNEPRLRWNASEFHEINGFFVIRDTVWRPDILPYDVQSITDARDKEVQHVYVKSNGDMTFYSSNVMTLVCPINIQQFPFDHQSCELGFVSYNFLTTELLLESSVRPSLNISESGNGEWVVDEVSTGDPYVMYESTQANYTAVYFIIHLRRSSTFYVVMIILPSFILTFLCVLGLFWTKFDKTDYLDKLALGFAAILAMCTVLEIAEQSTPKTEQLPALSLFIMVNLLVVTVAISIVVMGSKCCQFTSATRLVEGSKKCMPSFRIKLCLSLRKICLIVFPILTLINLLILLLNLRS